MSQPLSPDQMYPAGVAGVDARYLTLSTGVRVRVAESGPATGKPLVLLHGWGASLYLFHHALALLPAHGIRAIAVDLRGFGLSDKPSARGAYSTDAYTADLDALLDALHLERPVLVGQSMGGGVVLRYALRRPERVRGIALINPCGLVRIPLLRAARIAPRRLVDAFAGRLVSRSLVGFILRHLAYGEPAHVAPRDVDEYWAPTQLPGFASAAGSALSDFDWQPITDTERASLTVPAVVILGRNDRLIRSADGAARRLRGSEVHVFPGGHCVNAELPDAIYGLIGAFSSRVFAES